jgi:hypothetical protein
LLLLDADPDSAAILTALLLRQGHCVQRAPEESAPPDAVIVALPAPLGLTPEKLLDAPLLLVVDGRLPHGEPEAWIAGRTRWAMLSKPVRESALELVLARITRPAEAASATPPPSR